MINRLPFAVPRRTPKVFGMPTTLPGTTVPVGSLIVHYVPIAGTWAFRDGWCTDALSPFQRFLSARGFEAIRHLDGRPFRWSTDLDGVRVWARHSQWEAGADALYYASESLPYEDRNYLAHSHGGQLVALLAAQGFRIRSLTTIGTPYRDDIPWAEAERHIAFHQHIYDDSFDLMGWLGGWFDGGRPSLSDRSFQAVPAVMKRPTTDIDHSRVLREENYIPMWESRAWLQAIRCAGVKEAA